MSGKTDRSRASLSATPAFVFFPCTIGRSQREPKSKLPGELQKANLWQSDVIASSTCLIFEAIPQACWLKPLPVDTQVSSVGSSVIFLTEDARQGAAKTLVPRGCPKSFRADLSHALEPSSNPIGISMARIAESSGLPSNGREVDEFHGRIRDVRWTLKPTQPQRQPSIPATNILTSLHVSKYPFLSLDTCVG